MSAVSLSLCTECTVPIKKCNNRICFCFWNRNKKKKSKQEKETIEKNHNEVNMSILNAPQVKVDLTPEEIEQSDFYLFNTDLEYLVVQGPNIHEKYMERKDVIGKKIDECDLPPTILEFLSKLYKGTLEDRYFQMQIFWDDKTYLLNTYPVKDEESVVIGGLLTCRHSNPHLHDLSIFELKNDTSKNKERKKSL